MPQLARTLGELKASGYPDRTVKDELRDNLIDRLSEGRDLFSGIIGFEESVVPTLEKAILAGHDVILLGERGQAKSRLIRSLVALLDEAVPAIEGCEVNDHPFHPICRACRTLTAERGEATPLTWIGRDHRFSEKLATPDTSVGDLIGDVDPIRVAEGHYLSDELTIHYGLVPRTNRGIFAVNELPDLPERIQVGLLNILEERDVQVRGYKIRLPLDLMLIASANPEDYTHRGRIISPLKDRFGTQVRTHYPVRSDDEIAIMDQEASRVPSQVPVRVPRYVKEILAEFTALLRASGQVNQRSGVSVRFSIGNLETVSAGALRRAVRTGEAEAVARIVDLWGVLPASTGRIEFDALEEGREEEILARAMRKAIMAVWQRRLSGENFDRLAARFDEGLTIETSDLMPSSRLLAQFEADGPIESLVGIQRLVGRLDLIEESPASAASAVEMCLEGLYLNRRVSKHEDALPGRYRYGAGD